MTVVEGQLDARELRIGIVVARFNSFVTERLVEGATDCIVRHGGSSDAITLVRVPGSWEIPLAVQHLAASGQVDGIVALGAVIRGSTPHFDYVAAEVSKGIASIGLEQRIPITFGVLTTDSIEQAIERAGTKAGNKGWDAALGVIEMVGVTRELARRK
jgi:6,7-dimethyl-8-ribityllumazine synthase